jgi:hypothetical protein
MGKHIVFLVHGMGAHDNTWAEDSIDILRKAYESFELLSLFTSFDERFEFVAVRYDDIFEELRAQWSQDAQPVLDLLNAGKLPKSGVTELAKLGDAATNDDFIATHLLDVFLYRFVPQIGERVRRQVADGILGRLKSEPGPWHWSILGHSLGTSVVHDTLHQMFTDADIGPTMKRARAKLVMMVSNVGRLLEQPGMDVYKTISHPSADPLRGVCGYYFNVKHEWDPFPRPKEFRPTDDWPDVVTRAQGRFRRIEINAFASKNIHSLEHYLGNPRVHAPFFRLLSTPSLIPDEHFHDAVAKYEASTPLGAFEKLQKQLKDLQIADEASWQQVIKAFGQFFDVIRQF